MKEQNYANHARLVPGYHFVLTPVLLATCIGSLVNLWKSLGDHQRLYSASLIAVLSFCAFFIAGYARIFALKAQDRAIRAEENLRHFVLAGRLLDPRLSVKQIVALRFASDGEFVDLARRAAEEGMEPDAIKRAIRNWRADHYRV
ncbi:MAG: hypothetical protein KatS3mg004_3667 [Bryobacteraceae bacterium]|nr:MAG: hypothetical protein KatS3mg004_3667 [Bryobacteraceae bacterium]